MNIGCLSKTLEISNDEIERLNDVPLYSPRKYVSPILNLANRFTFATSPKKMGIQLSDLFQTFLSTTENVAFEDWKTLCKTEVGEGAINNSVDEILHKCSELAKVAGSISKEEVREWVENLLYTKTYNGLNLQHLILSKIANEKGTEYVKASKEAEAKGIDGFIDGVPYSVKPKSYYVQNPSLVEWIDAVMVFYEKTKRGLSLEIYK